MTSEQLHRLVSYFYTLLLLCCLTACVTKGPNDDKEVLPEQDYSELYRPQIHFTPPAKWMNDPNGMVYYEGEYHLFYQYYPDSTVWGPMHWGHAVSQDMVSWEHLPVALYPDSLGYIFSGSAVVDWNNTTGFGKNEQPPLVAIYTYHDPVGEKAGRNDFQYQGIAYSNDKGRTWTKYSGNPVVPNLDKVRDFRDPKVSWHEASQQWVMVFAAKDQVQFWGSPDLKSWEHLSNFGQDIGAHGGVWECPDLFSLRVGDSTEEQDILLVSINPGAPNGGSGTQYFVGKFDGKEYKLAPGFKPETAGQMGRWLDFGRDNYAGVTWSDVPQTDGRRLFIGWMSNWSYATIVPTESWRSAMTLPRELTLEKHDGEYFVHSQAVSELKALRTETFSLRTGLDDENVLGAAAGAVEVTNKFKPSAFAKELMLVFEISDEGESDLGLELSNDSGQRYRIGYNSDKNSFYSDRTESGKHDFSDDFGKAIHYAPRIVDDKMVRLHLFIDVASAELFADGGATNMTDIFFPDEYFNKIKIYASGAPVKIWEAKGFSLDGIWGNAKK